ncbi:MAG TPA: PQQ-binding-like beta-propeller repeat protein [Gemmataceae bacterium]|nr:PQQ-binding-like beta-propeller repeat protein [Gemmataceae bacterium]
MTHRILSLALLLASAGTAVAQESIGWRTDGTGRYPKADPPIHWGVDKNVVWKTKMPSFSVATPVIVGDKIFTCSEPTWLLCVNKADGKILWEKKSTRDEIPWTADDKEKLKVEREQAAVWQTEQRALEKEINALNKMAQEDKDNAKELRKKADALRVKRDELDRKRRALPLLQRATEPYRDGTAGYSQCTPVSNGKQVFVMFGNGLVACYDLDGTRRWLTLMEHSDAAYGHGSSPTLIGDKLILRFKDLVALNIKDGSEAWRVKLPGNALHGTAIHTRIAGVDCAILPTGQIVQAADGKIVAVKLGQSGDNAPILQDGVVYFVNGNTTAYRLPMSLTANAEGLWKANLKGGDYWFASPIYHDGLLYAVNGNCNFSVVDAKTGKLVYTDRLNFGGRVYPSICQAGKYIYVSSDNGTTIVLEPGREYKEIARNELETFRSSPIFEGRRMYVRTQKHLWCIGE